MKLLAFVDIHGDKTAIQEILTKSKEADLLVCAGDISDWGRNERKILKELSKANKPMLLIPGNHEIEEELAQIAQEFEYVSYIHQGSYQIEDYYFFGYGGGGFAEHNKKFEKIMKRFKKTIPKNSKVILVTHGPPHGTKLDKLYDRYTGCKSIRKFIDEIQPDLSISGHIHETFGKKEVIGKTLVINPGPEGRILLL